PTGHEIAFTLRPGERLVYRWDNVGKWAADREGVEPKYWGNSRFIYEPRLDLASVRRDASQVRGLADAEHGAGLQVQGSNGALVYEISPSYVICGGRVRAEFVARGDGDRLSISLSTDGHSFQRVWEHEGSGPVTADVSLDEALQPHQNPPKYRYLVGVRMGSKTGLSDAMLTSLRIETDVMAAPLSLPRLSLGANHIVYTDDTPGPHSVRVTHRWQECDAIQPPAPPSGPVHLPPGARVTDSILEYSWPEVAGADRYHLQVSRRPDFAWPYRTSLDVMIPDTAWRMPHTGIYSPGTTYYWRLRARDHSGVWGPWSDTWTFTWRGPRVPVNVRLHFDGRTGTLRWEPNPRGERPVRYATFGSNERGFTAHREPYTQFKRGEVPANLIGETTESSMVVITDQRPAENMNCVFYRVVAIDERGTESGSSEYAEAPHPFIYTSPVTRATAGRLYGYEAGSLGSLGDCQNRPKPEEGGYNYGYHDIEENRFELLESPRWLSVDAETGLVSGTPPPEAAGEHQVRLGVTNQFGGRDEQRFTLRVAK
ncbi:MAG: Ig domain-containing protein, partial [Armatimonadota bacterium]|nr:Ig domain-containing protein [Armatimonadota bacterium]